MTFLLYLGKVMLCSGILLGYYWFFLRNKRFHHYNRFYLLATLLVSVLVPLIKIPVLYHSQNPVNHAVYQTIQVLTVNYGEDDMLHEAPDMALLLWNMQSLLYLIYLIGTLVLFFALVRSLLYIRRISRRYPAERIGGLKFFNTREPGTPFSFFRKIFWNNELAFNSQEGQQIFQHELFHVQQKHSSDIIITELITALFWFNPFFRILKKELKAIHEFLADQYAISGNDRYAYAELLVLQTMKANHLPITNHFFQNHIKRRIAMITNNQSARITYRSRLMVLPVLALVFCSIAFRAQRTAVTENGKPVAVALKPVTVMIDAGHGGIDPGATSPDGKVKEKDLALQISQKIQQLASAYNVNVVMTRTDDNLPGGTADITNGLRARTAMANEIRPAMYISIHVSLSGEPTATDRTGFEIYVPNDTTQRANESKQLGSDLTRELSKLYATNQTLKQRSDKNIWVLQRTPCPALLIECGFIDNEKDLAYFSNNSNQEAIAKKILEGIVNYNNKSTTTIKPVGAVVPVNKTTPVSITDNDRQMLLPNGFLWKKQGKC
jgi:N-acetylmuramoyl-L-alanine amidase